LCFFYLENKIKKFWGWKSIFPYISIQTLCRFWRLCNSLVVFTHTTRSFPLFESLNTRGMPQSPPLILDIDHILQYAWGKVGKCHLPFVFGVLNITNGCTFLSSTNVCSLTNMSALSEKQMQMMLNFVVTQRKAASWIKQTWLSALAFVFLVFEVMEENKSFRVPDCPWLNT